MLACNYVVIYFGIYFRIFKKEKSGAFLMVLLIAECNFTKTNFFLEIFSNKYSEINYKQNITTTCFARSHTSFSETLYQSSKISPFTSFGISERM